MKVKTNSERVKAVRQLVMELLLARCPNPKKVKEIAGRMIKNSGRAIKLSKRLIHMGTYVNAQGFLMEGDAFADDFASKEPYQIFMEFFKDVQRKKKEARAKKRAKRAQNQ